MTLETLKAVEQELQGRDIPTSLEYPGSIQISQGLQVTLIFGDANKMFSCDVVEAGNYVIETIESVIPSDSADVTQIADFVACIYSEALKECW